MVERMVNKRMVRFGIWMAVYSAVIFADSYWLPRPVKTDIVHVVGALVPMIPLLFAMQANIGAIQLMDELGRRVCVEGMMFATISLGWVWPIIAAFYGIGAAFARRKYS